MGQEASSLWNDIVPWVDPERCRRCAECAPVSTCLAKGFGRDGLESVPVVDENSCFGCYSCAAACPHGAILLPRYR